MVTRFILLLMFGAVSVSADTFIVHCPVGCPTSPATNHLVIRHLYVLSNNPTRRFADWVAYEVDILNFGDSPGRAWKNESSIPHDERIEDADYTRSGYQRGHLAPLASFAGSDYWPEVNLMSNVVPQLEDMNSGPWGDLEKAVRDAVGFRDSLFVITGTLYERPMTAMAHADEPHSVPSGFYKIVYDRDGRASAFFIDQTARRTANYCNAEKTVAEIQTRLNAIGTKLPPLTDSSAVKHRIGCSTP